ncbi:hypothetical protein [Streptomyces sp. NBC_01304]|uniref:hypothetical protein n=1 Tax=Streptomyces sp. NBC_01304 TaxID=2903818 RepID=UPI002E15CF11|nr:hypothetical protein OG430_07745 [Streptomyces sp. NBC_01304]
MTDNGGSQEARQQRLSEKGAATDPQPEGLLDSVTEREHGAYVRLSTTYPQQQVQLQLIYSASQRALELKTRESVRITVMRVLANALSDPRLGEEKPNKHLTDYLDQEIAELHARLQQDCAMSVSQGLNRGLALGMGLSAVLLGVPLLWGLDVLYLLGISLNCSSRWTLLAAVVCGGVGALGAALSVLVRVRNGSKPPARRTDGRETSIVPAQMFRAMFHEGVYRVLVGWILALALYFIIGGGIVDVLKVPATTSDMCPTEGAGSAAKGTDFWVFWCAVGFLAGFNERWAFGLLHRQAKTTKP